MANRLSSWAGVNKGVGKPCGICGRNIPIDKVVDWHDPMHKSCLKKEEAHYAAVRKAKAEREEGGNNRG